jgi:hypothetical protein
MASENARLLIAASDRIQAFGHVEELFRRRKLSLENVVLGLRELADQLEGGERDRITGLADKFSSNE